MVNWDQWQTLLAVFRAGTYTKAAASLQVDATTVGRRLKLLERQLGHPLFMRHDGRLHPTRPCEDLIAAIETASEVLRAAEQGSAASERGIVWRDLRMTAPPFLIRHLFAPAIAELTAAHRIRVELMGTGSHAGLVRREADIAIRIDDRAQTRKKETGLFLAEPIGTLAYAVYCRRDLEPADLPWAGLMEDYGRTSGDEVMMRLTDGKGFQFRAYHFDVLEEIAATGAARVMLPCFAADADRRLKSVSEVVLKQSLWMVFHRQDQDLHHLKGARAWIKVLAAKALDAPSS